MGNYSWGDHVDLFGGPPEPGEAYPDLEQVDLARKAAKEDGRPFAWSAVDLGEPVVVESGHEAAVRKGVAPSYVPAPRRPWWRRWRRDA